MFDSAAEIALMIILAATALFSLISMLIMRRRLRERDDLEKVEAAHGKIDDAVNTALSEINKMAQIAMEEINSTYQASLFLYNLLDEKKKEIELWNEHTKPLAPKASQPFTAEPLRNKPRAATGNKQYEKIWELYNKGASVSDIAKILSMGQGEVKLVLDLTGK